jgi:hypothetical protein
VRHKQPSFAAVRVFAYRFLNCCGEAKPLPLDPGRTHEAPGCCDQSGIPSFKADRNYPDPADSRSSNYGARNYEGNRYGAVPACTLQPPESTSEADGDQTSDLEQDAVTATGVVNVSSSRPRSQVLLVSHSSGAEPDGVWMIAMADHATYVIADRAVGCRAERMPKRPSDAAGERRPKA